MKMQYTFFIYIYIYIYATYRATYKCRKDNPPLLSPSHVCASNLSLYFPWNLFKRRRRKKTLLLHSTTPLTKISFEKKSPFFFFFFFRFFCASVVLFCCVCACRYTHTRGSEQWYESGGVNKCSHSSSCLNPFYFLRIYFIFLTFSSVASPFLLFLLLLYIVGGG